MNIKKIKLPDFSDERGSLVAVESAIDIPFEIKRIYFMYGSDFNEMRGGHAHYTLNQVFIPVHGHCQIELYDGNEKITMLLDNPKEGLFLGNLIWREVTKFSNDCVLLVLASEHFDEKDYIRNIDEYNEKVNG